MLTMMIAIWTVITLVLIALSIHRSIFVMREEDTLFLSKAENATKNAYATISKRLRRLEFALKLFSFTSGVLALVIAAFWVYQRLYG